MSTTKVTVIAEQLARLVGQLVRVRSHPCGNLVIEGRLQVTRATDCLPHGVVYSVRVGKGKPGSGSEVLARFEPSNVYDVWQGTDSPSGLPTVNLR